MISNQELLNLGPFMALYDMIDPEKIWCAKTMKESECRLF
ncbi:hypothetical protein KP78_33840 [Jeotgalibacillus soli]|uniref:Uncharacterized protein n=1 Tax=Jeotgalibacillus soli TaxID=889306 RepID=A0A0C2R2B3_9BACL|nr:hypothetical protein KP78_33840 [Jeotgalibacillus soli]